MPHPAAPRDAEVALRLEDIAPRAAGPRRQPRRSIAARCSVSAGLVGAGRSELVRIVFGVDRPDGGVMTLDGQALCAAHAGRRDAGGRRPGAGGAPLGGAGAPQEHRLQSRARQSRPSSRRARPAGSSTGASARAWPHEMVERLRIKTPGIDTPVGRLSRRQPAEGGDRQVAGARAAHPHPRRADARRRHRRARRDPPADPGACRRRRLGHRHLVRSRGAAGGLRPRPGDGRGQDRPHAQPGRRSRGTRSCRRATPIDDGGRGTATLQ